jgi:alkylated DNA repair dioxygenase AlkB
MENLFNPIFTQPVLLNLPDAEIIYVPNFVTLPEANLLFEYLLNNIPWQQDMIKVYGKLHQQPRLTSLFGDAEKSYQYSNIKMHPHPWNTSLLKIKNQIELFSNHKFTTVLLNLYRDGKDSNGWHADNEKELGTNPVIASLSLGSPRDFHLKHNILKEQKAKITLEHGSLLLMKGTTQHFWKHQIPKTQKPISARINLTFRTLV